MYANDPTLRRQLNESTKGPQKRRPSANSRNAKRIALTVAAIIICLTAVAEALAEPTSGETTRRNSSRAFLPVLAILTVAIFVSSAAFGVAVAHGQGKTDVAPPPKDALQEHTKAAYDNDPEGYRSYADGPGLYSFGEHRQYGIADEKLWLKIQALIDREVQRGKKLIRVLDVGCGPGTWTLRIVDTCWRRGIAVRAVGIDLSPGMVENAREQLAEYCETNPGVKTNVVFVEGDICRPLPFADGEFDISLCLYTVLNHVPVESLPQAVREMLRVTNLNITTVRSKGGLPTVYVCGMDQVREWKQSGDRLTFTDRDGRKMELPVHLFRYDELRRLFDPAGEVEECFGLDIMVSRAMEQRIVNEFLPGDELVLQQLVRLEEEWCHQPPFIDISNHIVIIAKASARA